MFLAGHSSYLGSLSIFNEGYEEFYYHGKEYNNFLNLKISLVGNHCLALGGNSAVISEDIWQEQDQIHIAFHIRKASH